MDPREGPPLKILKAGKACMGDYRDGLESQFSGSVQLITGVVREWPPSCLPCTLAHSLGNTYFPPCLHSATTYSLVALCSSPFLLLLQPPTQKQHCRNPCPTSSLEWVADGGGGRGKGMLEKVSGNHAGEVGEGSTCHPKNGQVYRGGRRAPCPHNTYVSLVTN